MHLRLLKNYRHAVLLRNSIRFIFYREKNCSCWSCAVLHPVGDIRQSTRTSAPCSWTCTEHTRVHTFLLLVVEPVLNISRVHAFQLLVVEPVLNIPLYTHFRSLKLNLYGTYQSTCTSAPCSWTCTEHTRVHALPLLVVEPVLNIPEYTLLLLVVEPLLNIGTRVHALPLLVVEPVLNIPEGQSLDKKIVTKWQLSCHFHGFFGQVNPGDKLKT